MKLGGSRSGQTYLPVAHLGNVTSTTFWTSARSEPNSIQDFPKSNAFWLQSSCQHISSFFSVPPRPWTCTAATFDCRLCYWLPYWQSWRLFSLMPHFWESPYLNFFADQFSATWDYFFNLLSPVLLQTWAVHPAPYMSPAFLLETGTSHSVLDL